LKRRRLRWLAVLEWCNIPLQGLIWFGYVGLPTTVANVVGFGLFAWVLVQGGAYWLLKLRQLHLRLPRLPGIRAFGALRTINVVMLLAGGVLVVSSVARQPGIGSWPGLGFAVFAILEHINYFHVQLMHDTRADWRRLRSSGLRRSHLAADLRA
jgi:hypothetical protein